MNEENINREKELDVYIIENIKCNVGSCEQLESCLKGDGYCTGGSCK